MAAAATASARCVPSNHRCVCATCCESHVTSMPPVHGSIGHHTPIGCGVSFPASSVQISAVCLSHRVHTLLPLCATRLWSSEWHLSVCGSPAHNLTKPCLLCWLPSDRVHAHGNVPCHSLDLTWHSNVSTPREMPVHGWCCSAAPALMLVGGQGLVGNVIIP